MKHAPVQSSTISTVGYDPDKQQLHVTYNTGGTYVYHDIPPETHQAMMMSSSKGKFLHTNVKGRHRHTKL